MMTLFRSKCALMLVLVALFVLPLQTTRAQEDSPTQEDDLTRLQIVNLFDAAASVDVWLGQDRLVSGLGAGESSGFFTVATGGGLFRVVTADADPEEGVLVEAEFNLTPDNWGILTLMGAAEQDNYRLNMLEIILGDFTANHTRLLFYNAVEEGLYEVLVGDGFRTVLAYSAIWRLDLPLEVDHSFRIFTPENESEILAEVSNPDLAAYHTYFIALYEQDGALQTFISDINLSADVVAGNFAFEDSPVTFLFNNDIIDGLGYQANLGRLSLPIGTYDLQVLPIGAPIEDGLISPQNIRLDSEQIYYLFLVGDGADGYQVVIEQFAPDRFSGTPVESGQNSYLNIYNAIANGPPLDVILADGTLLIESLAFGDGMAVLDLLSGEYDLLITPANDPQTILYNLTDITLRRGTYYLLIPGGDYEAISAGESGRLFVTSSCVALEGCE